VAAGGGGAEVPAGYKALELKVFVDRAGKGKTHNWQLNTVLTGRLLQHMAVHDTGCRLQDAWAQEAYKLSYRRRALLAVGTQFLLFSKTTDHSMFWPVLLCRLFYLGHTQVQGAAGQAGSLCAHRDIPTANCH
jgi:hypothetical protein